MASSISRLSRTRPRIHFEKDSRCSLGWHVVAETERPVALSRGGIDIATTVDSCQSAISGGNDIDFLRIDALVFVIEQWNRFLSSTVSETFFPRTIEAATRK